MNQNMAIEIVSYMNSIFPTVALEDEDFAVLVKEIALLADAQIGLEAARMLCRGNVNFPTLAEFRAQYRSIAESRRLDTPALPPAPRGAIPTWVHVWYWARHGRSPRETRSLPQQREGLADPPFMTEGEYLQLEAEWRAAGSPAFRDVTALLRPRSMA